MIFFVTWMTMNEFEFIIYGIKINEPLATATDLLVTTVCLWAFFKLRRSSRTDLAYKYFNFFFLTMAIATFFGGILGHAFINEINFAWKLPGWLTSMFSISLLERASIKHAKKYLHPSVAKFYEIINIIELLVVMIITFSTLDFFWVEMHSGFGLLAVILPVQLFTFIKTKDKGSFLFLFGVGVALISAVFFMNKISYNESINYLAFSHFFMAIGSYIFYLASQKVISDDNFKLSYSFNLKKSKTK